MNESNIADKSLTLQEAAQLTRTSRSRLWRAMSEGKLQVEKRLVSGRNVWTVLETDLAEWAKEYLDADEFAAMNSSEQTSEHRRTFANDREHLRTHEMNVREHPRMTADDRGHSRTIELNIGEHPRTSADVQSEQEPSPPLELYLEMLDRLSRAERRSIELELQLRQSQRLLTENAESITEKEALATTAQAKLQEVEDLKQTEIDRLAAETQRLNSELEQTRQQLLEANQKPKGLFSWLGLRQKRTSSPLTKAVSYKD